MATGSRRHRISRMASCWPVRDPQPGRSASDLQGQHQPQRGVDVPELVERQVADAGTQAGRVDRRGLFGEHSRRCPGDLDLRPEAGRP